jgi:hypothetical protein
MPHFTPRSESLTIFLKLPAASCRESSKCKEVIPFYCSSLANPAARLVDELRSSRSESATRGEEIICGIR